MEITIFKSEDEKIMFKLNEEDYEFDYNGLDKFIETFYSNNEKVNFKCDEEYKEYEKLLENILTECRKEDYVSAVNGAIKSQEELEEAEKELSDENDENVFGSNDSENTIK